MKRQSKFTLRGHLLYCNPMRRVLDLRGCLTLEVSRAYLGKSKPDFVLVDDVWVKNICGTHCWKTYRGIPVSVAVDDK